jgi:hypothetical protein
MLDGRLAAAGDALISSIRSASSTSTDRKT